MKGIGFTGLLAILFIAFKLAGIIDWSWVWVLCPLWIGIALFLAIIAIVALVAVAKEASLKGRRKIQKGYRK